MGNFCCRTALPARWLQSVYAYLHSIDPYPLAKNGDSGVLYETLASCLDVDILVWRGESEAEMIHNVVPWNPKRLAKRLRKRIERFFEGLTSEQWSRQDGSLDKQVRIPVLRPETPVWGRRRQTRHGTIAIAVSAENADAADRRLCNGCFAKVIEFLENPHGSGRVGSEVDPTESRDTSLRETLREALRSVVYSDSGLQRVTEVATTSFLRTLVAKARVWLPREYQPSFEKVYDVLRGTISHGARTCNDVPHRHAFSFAILFDHHLLTERDSGATGHEFGFGYFLTKSQQHQIRQRLGDNYRDAIRAFQKGVQFRNDTGQGLVNSVVQRQICLWSANLFAERIWRTRALDETLDSRQQKIADFEDQLVHQVEKNGQENFIFEFPVFVQSKDGSEPSVGAAMFFVLPDRPPAPVLSLLLLSARSAASQVIDVVFSSLGPSARRDLLLNDGTIILQEPPADRTIMLKMFPQREGGVHEAEAIFQRPIDTLRAAVRDWSAKGLEDQLGGYQDLLPLLRLAHDGDEIKVRWGVYGAKMRVRTARYQDSIYILDLFHYLSAWNPTAPGEYLDLQALRADKQHIEFLKGITISVSVSMARTEWLVAQRRPLEPGAPSVGWYIPRLCPGTSAHAGAEPVDHPWQAKWEFDHDVFRRLIRARFDVPGNSIRDFLVELAEAISEVKPARVHLLVGADAEVLRVEFLAPSFAAKIDPADIIKKKFKDRSQEYGTINKRSGQVVEDWQGAFFVLPLKLETSDNAESTAPFASDRGPDAAAEPLPREKSKVLVVNDSADDRDAWKQWLFSHFEVQEAGGLPDGESLSADQEERANQIVSAACACVQRFFAKDEPGHIVLDVVFGGESKPHGGERLAAKLRAAGYRQRLWVWSSEAIDEGLVWRGKDGKKRAKGAPDQGDIASIFRHLGRVGLLPEKKMIDAQIQGEAILKKLAQRVPLTDKGTLLLLCVLCQGYLAAHDKIHVDPALSKDGYDQVSIADWFAPALTELASLLSSDHGAEAGWWQRLWPEDESMQAPVAALRNLYHNFRQPADGTNMDQPLFEGIKGFRVYLENCPNFGDSWDARRLLEFHPTFGNRVRDIWKDVSRHRSVIGHWLRSDAEPWPRGNQDVWEGAFRQWDQTKLAMSRYAHEINDNFRPFRTVEPLLNDHGAYCLQVANQILQRGCTAWIKDVDQAITEVDQAARRLHPNLGQMDLERRHFRDEADVENSLRALTNAADRLHEIFNSRGYFSHVSF